MRLLLLVDRANARDANKIRMVAGQHDFVVPRNSSVTMLSVHEFEAKRHNVDGIVCACTQTLRKLVEAEGQKIDATDGSVTLHNYRGSMYHIGKYPVIIMDNLRSIFAFPYGKEIARRYINKITKDTPVPIEPDFLYTDFASNAEALYAKACNEALMIAVDIETVKAPVDLELLARDCAIAGCKTNGLWAMMKVNKNSKKLTPCSPIIDMVGYSLLLKDKEGNLYSESFTIPFDSLDNINWVRKFNSTKAPKVLQNGGYDSTYFIRFGCPMYNWIYDTFHFMHSWYAEMPRDLGFICSLFLVKNKYWKNEIGTNRLEYCAKDVHGTLWAMLFMVKEAPNWALLNYQTVFKKVFPNICAGLEGDKIDFCERDRLLEKYTSMLEAAQTRLNNYIYEGFNANSSKQVLRLMHALSPIKWESSDKIAMRRWSEEHPLNMLIAEAIADIREAGKKISTYITATDLDGRLLYEINASGTDTGRASSKASNLWVGTQRQNIDGKIKSMFVADDGWEYAACDGAQAESRTTAYISEDPNLINTVEHAPDFHTRNASMFFGIPEEDVCPPIYTTVEADGVELETPLLDEKGKPVRDKKLRNLGKRVNHGANYNMGATVLIETMGMRMVLEAKYLLGLTNIRSLGGVAEYLLGRFDATYPMLRGKYYDEVIEEVARTNMLKIPCEEIHWVRYCFGSPSRTRKMDLNMYVASMPQGLSAHILDKAWFDFWYEYQIKRNIIRVKAAVHDEIQYQIRLGDARKEETGAALAGLMSRYYTIRGRKMRIPADTPIYGHRLSDVKD